jgi:hypothetical protein
MKSLLSLGGPGARCTGTYGLAARLQLRFAANPRRFRVDDERNARTCGHGRTPMIVRERVA